MTKRLSPAQESLLRYFAVSDDPRGIRTRRGTDWRTLRILRDAKLIAAGPEVLAGRWVVTESGRDWLSEHPITFGKVDAS